MKKKVKRMMPIVEHINKLEPEMEKLTDEELRAKTEEFKEHLRNRETSSDFKKDRALEKKKRWMKSCRKPLRL